MKLNKSFNPLALAVLSLSLGGCATQVEQHWDQRDARLNSKLAQLDKVDPKPEEFLALVREYEKNKTDFKDNGYVDYVYIRQMSVNQLTQRLRMAVERQETKKVNSLITAILEIDPGNEAVKAIVGVGMADEASDADKDQSTLFTQLAPTSSMGASYNLLVHQSVLSAARDGRQYRALYDVLKQPLRDGALPPNSPLPQQMAYLSQTYGFKFSCEPDLAAAKEPVAAAREPAGSRAPRSLIQYLGELASLNKVNFVVLPDQVYCFSGDLPSKDIDGGEHLSVFRAEFISVELLVGMLKMVVGDTNIVMADESTKSVWVRSNRAKFMQAFDLVRSIDFPEAEIEVQMELYEVSASLLHRVGLRVPQLIRAGIGNAVDGGGINWQTWLTQARSQSLRMMISDGAFQLNAQSQNLYASTLSQPRIRVQDGQRARLFVGDKTPVFSSTLGQGGFVSESVNYVSTGVTLEVEAKIVAPNLVQVAVNLDSTELGTLVTTAGGSSANAVTSRTTVTRLTIGDNATEMLGGYVRRVKTKERDGLPGIGATALSPVGGVSGIKDSDVELLIFITPRIIKPKLALSNRLLKASTKGDPRYSAPLILSPNGNSPMRALFQVPQINNFPSQPGAVADGAAQPEPNPGVNGAPYAPGQPGQNVNGAPVMNPMQPPPDLANPVNGMPGTFSGGGGGRGRR